MMRAIDAIGARVLAGDFYWSLVRSKPDGLVYPDGGRRGAVIKLDPVAVTVEIG